MYFSLDLQGKRHRVQSDHVVDLEHEPATRSSATPTRICSTARRADGFQARFQEFLEKGSVEEGNLLGQIRRRDRSTSGSSARSFRAPRIRSRHARFVAQDVTAKRLLEAELQEKNQRLARSQRRALAAEPRARRVRLRRLARSPGAVAHFDRVFRFPDEGLRRPARGRGTGVCALPGRRLPADAGHDSWNAEPLPGRQGDRRIRRWWIWTS